jgi:translocation and assembly module TamB
LELRVTPPPSPAPDQLPLSAEIAGSFDARRSAVTIHAAELATRSIHLTATGALGSSTSKLDFNLTASSLNELQPLLQSMGSTAQIPVHLNGNAQLRGTVRGTVAAPQLNANVQLADFDLVLSAPQRKQIHWDSLLADVEYTRTALGIRNGKLTRGKAAIAFAGNTTLPKGRFGEGSVFSANANITGAPLDDIQALAGYNYPVTGTLNAQVTAQGTKQNMRGSAQLGIANGTAYGEPFKNLRADAQLLGQDVRLQSLSLSQNGATLTATGAYNLQSKAFRAEMHARNIDLAHISKLQMQRLTLAGLGTIDATASGTVQQPTIQASINIRDIIANGEHIGDIHADAVTQGREMQLKFRSQLEAASLEADGSVHLAGDFPANIAVHFENLDFDPVLRAFFQDRITGHSSMNGRVDISGPFKRPKFLQVRALVPELSAQIEKITLTNAEPIELTYAGQIATINRLHLRGEGTDFEARGRVNLADQSVNINATGDLNLKLAEGFNPDLLSYGTANMQMAIGGNFKKPLPTGQLTIRDAGVSIIDLPNGLANINGTLVFNENRLQVRSLTANTGGGTLNVGGFISYQNGIYFDLTATGADVRLRYPPGISASANADLRYTGNLKSSQLSGDVLVTRFGINPRFDFALYLARGKNPPTAPKANPILDNLRLDVHVTSTPELRVETQLAKISGDVDLRIRGTASKPAVLGRINIAEGDIFFNSTKYHLERGDITFTNPVTIEPVINVEASARVREYDITLGFHGSTAKGINTTYRSEPPLPTADIIALLALGRTREDAVLNPPAQQNFAETASNAILGQALDAAVSSRVQKLFGVSRIKIDPQVGGVETATGARITIEQQVNNNVTLTYITNVSRANQQVIQGEFNFTRDISLVIVRDENGVLGFDVRIRQRVK